MIVRLVTSSTMPVVRLSSVRRISPVPPTCETVRSATHEPPEFVIRAQVAWPSASTVVFVGHQAAGTRGQLLIDGAPSVRIFGEFIDVACSVKHIESLSAHADRDELVSWISRISQPPTKTYIVHGEPSAAESMCNEIETRLNWPVDIAIHGETVRVPSKLD